MSTKARCSLPLMIAAALAFPAGASAEERDCRGAIGAETLDNVRVPSGASCTLNVTRVKGTIKVESGATLHASGVGVVGNVQAENAAQVVVASSTVGGSVQVKQGGAADVTSTAVTGDIQYDQNAGPLNTSRNHVGGNVQVVGNRAPASIFNNTVDGNLQCKENSPAPVGGDNRVRGSSEDQCARFAGGAGAEGGRPGAPGGDPGARGALGQHALLLMSPFPVVRVAGRATRRGARIHLLTVRAQPGASVRVTCRGRGCPFKRLDKTISARVREGRRLPVTRLVRVRRLEGRLLRPRAILRVFVTHQGLIGKYTRFRIRRTRAPLRTDMCVLLDGSRPLRCPPK